MRVQDGDGVGRGISASPKGEGEAGLTEHPTPKEELWNRRCPGGKQRGLVRGRERMLQGRSPPLFKVRLKNLGDVEGSRLQLFEAACRKKCRSDGLAKGSVAPPSLRAMATPARAGRVTTTDDANSALCL